MKNGFSSSQNHLYYLLDWNCVLGQIQAAKEMRQFYIILILGVAIGNKQLYILKFQNDKL